MKTAAIGVHLGYEVGTGAPVEIPLAHTFVTGQTQLSGKTTALRAIVERSGQRALAFVTKRGESFEGRRIRPYLPREGEKQIPWRLVEAVMAASLGQRNMKWERGAIVTATKGATTLAQVHANVLRLRDSTKNPRNQELYMLLGEYLDLVLPEMRALNAAAALDLQPGLNVMDLTDVGTQTQAMVIRAALEHINQHETGVLTVFPEAWEFAPRGRSAPAKDEAINMARKGAVLRNFLLCDSQDIAGVDTVVRQAASVWLLGVQRELNELKRTLQMMTAGVKRPKPEDVAQLELGQFYACWGRHAVKVYVQPTWLDDRLAILTAKGGHPVPTPDQSARPRATKENTVNAEEAKLIRDENSQLHNQVVDLRRENETLRGRLDRLEGLASGRGIARQDDARDAEDVDTPRASGDRPAATRTSAGSRGEAPGSTKVVALAGASTLDNDALYRDLLARLVKDAAKDPVLLAVIATKPELRVRVERQVIEVSEDSTRGMVAKLIVDGFYAGGQSSAATLKELQRRGQSLSPGTLYPELDKLAGMGFFRIEDGKDDRGRPRKEYHLVAGMRVNVVEA